MDTTVYHLPLSVRSGSAPARRLVAHALRRWRLGHRIDDTLIVVTELVENALRHAPPGSDLSLKLFPGVLRVEVTDGSYLPPVVRPEQYGGPGGRGLRIVRAIAALWNYTPTATGKVVWANLSTDGRRSERRARFRLLLAH
jgi:anti-sigma regulatory factor (Ser/Thr protein kinase)